MKKSILQCICYLTILFSTSTTSAMFYWCCKGSIKNVQDPRNTTPEQQHNNKNRPNLTTQNLNKPTRTVPKTTKKQVHPKNSKCGFDSDSFFDTFDGNDDFNINCDIS